MDNEKILYTIVTMAIHNNSFVSDRIRHSCTIFDNTSFYVPVERHKSKNFAYQSRKRQLDGLTHLNHLSQCYR